MTSNVSHRVVQSLDDTMKDEGDVGRYMRKAMLLAFVEEIGHDSAIPMEGAEDEEEEVAVEGDGDCFGSSSR